MTRRSQIAFALLILGVLGTLAAFLFRPMPPGEFVVDTTPPPVTVPIVRDSMRSEIDLTNRGGTYAGKVVDERGDPVSQADVLLIAVDQDATATFEGLEAEGVPGALAIPVFGEYRTAARTRTDEAGRFSIPAGNSAIVALFAWGRGFSPGILATTTEAPLKPGSEHVLRLARAGALRGLVVDAATREPVPYAQVALTFQAIANREHAGPDPFTPTNSFTRFQSYIARVIGPLVWGIEGRRSDGSFRFTTDVQGRFEFGPIMKEVQVEVVVTHPEYKWTEMDPEISFAVDNPKAKEGEKLITRRQRLVIPPGETIDKTYALVKGEEVRGKVLDPQGKPIEGVEVSLEHVAQYAQHYWYRSVSRNAKTDAQGRFRIAGLSYEPYVLKMTHPSFETEFFHGVKATPKGEVIEVEYRVAATGGWISLTVEGGPTDREKYLARVRLERGDTKSQRREDKILIEKGKGELLHVKAGTYVVTLVTDDRVSAPLRVEVPLEGQVDATFRLVHGGSVEFQVLDSAGRAVDPATVELEAVLEGERTLRRAAVVVARQGVAAATGLLPGRYRARVRAMGHVPVVTDPFDVLPESTTRLAPVRLVGQGFVKITGVAEADGRAIEGDVRLSLQIGDGKPQPMKSIDAGVLPVPSGPVTVIAETADGRKFEKSFVIGEGETVPVDIRFTR